MKRLVEYHQDNWRDVRLQQCTPQRPGSADCRGRRRPSSATSMSAGLQRQVSRPSSARSGQRSSPVKSKESGSPASRAIHNLRMGELTWNSRRQDWMPDWVTGHHLTNSKDNVGRHYNLKGYFDDLPTSHMVNWGSRKQPKKYAEKPLAVEDAAETADDGGQELESSKELEQRKRITKRKTLMLERFKVGELEDGAHEVPGVKELHSFYQWCTAKFKNLTRCWRLLDNHLNMKLAYMEFLTSLRKYDYDCASDARKIFAMLDRDSEGTLQYFHFDPHGALELAALVAWAEHTFGNWKKAFTVLDVDKNGKLTMAELMAGAKKYGLQHARQMIPHLYDMLDLDSDRKVTMEELGFLDWWSPPAWLKVIPDQVAAKNFKQSLIDHCKGNCLLAWRRLDRISNFRISWYEFHTACQQMLQEGLIQESKIPAIWRAFDDNISGWISLREFDKETHDLLSKFKRDLEEMYGSCSKYFDKLDHKKKKEVHYKMFAYWIMQDFDLKPEDAEALYYGLARKNDNGKDTIKISSLRYLESWDLEKEQADHEFWEAFRSSLKKDEDQLLKFDSSKEY